MELRVEDNEAEDLIGAALQRVHGVAMGREIITSLDPAHPLLFGRFDFSATLRALANLLENAIKYSPAGEPILLRVRRDGPWIEFGVSDRGPGIAPGDVERLFAPFVRGTQETPDAGGSGLGLTIARGIAESEGGSVAYAPRDGGGSVFTLRVPAAEIASPR
jgi:two-component system sensor histidine kinase KdpD